MKISLWLLVLILLCLFAATNCASPRASAPAAWGGPPVDTVSYWDGDHLSGPPSVQIRLSQQRAYLYKGTQLAGVSMISSGEEGRDTVTGNFRIIEKDKEHRSSLYGEYVDAQGTVIQKGVDTTKDTPPPGTHYLGANMPNFMRIVGGTGMHEGYLPGYPDSHGCIRMPALMAEAFYNSVEIGTPVSILP